MKSWTANKKFATKKLLFRLNSGGPSNWIVNWDLSKFWSSVFLNTDGLKRLYGNGICFSFLHVHQKNKPQIGFHWLQFKNWHLLLISNVQLLKLIPTATLVGQANSRSLKKGCIMDHLSLGATMAAIYKYCPKIMIQLLPSKENPIQIIDKLLNRFYHFQPTINFWWCIKS